MAKGCFETRESLTKCENQSIEFWALLSEKVMETAATCSPSLVLFQSQTQAGPKVKARNRAVGDRVSEMR